MTELLVLRERLKEIYSEYSKWIDATLRFVFAFFAMTIVNSRMGYIDASDAVLAIVALALICAVLPVGMSFVASCVFIILNLTKISALLAVVFVAVGILMYLLYFSFKPGNAYAATLGLAFGLMGLYAPLPMIVALLASPITFLPLMFGLVTSAFVGYIDVNYSVLVSPDHAANSIKQVVTIAKGVVSDESLWMNCFMILVILVAVYLLRKLFFKNNWAIAIFTGSFLYLILALIISMEGGLQEQGLLIFLNIVLALICGFVLHFFNYMVDASRVEHVQFEDDDYYYYVKVVPKIRVTTPEVRITKINSRKVKDEVKTSEQVVFLEQGGETEEKEPEVTAITEATEKSDIAESVPQEEERDKEETF